MTDFEKLADAMRSDADRLATAHDALVAATQQLNETTHLVKKKLDAILKATEKNRSQEAENGPETKSE